MAPKTFSVYSLCKVVKSSLNNQAAVQPFDTLSLLSLQFCFRSGAQMGIFSGAGAHRPSCPSAANCAKWAQTYLKYCLCSTRDGMALTLGLLSVISWGVAEVPQIITNYKHKSTEGLSLAFLMTWIVG